MQIRTLSLIAIAALAPLGRSQAGASAGHDLDAALGAWRAAHGENWQYAFDGETGWAQMLYGGHTPAPRSAPADDAAFAALALEAAAELAELHGLELSTLAFEETAFLPLGQIGSGDKQSVRLRQAVAGVPVEGGYLNLLFSTRGELLSAQSTGLPGASAIATQPALEAADAAAAARAHFLAATHFEALTTGTPELRIAQIVANHQRTGRLAWKVECRWSAPGSEPLRKLVSVDAATGALLRIDEGIQNFDVTGTLSSMASPGTLPDIASNPESAQLIKYGRCQSSAGTIYTNSAGVFNYPGVASNLSVTFKYIGLYASVNYAPGTDYSLVVSLPPGTANSVLLNPSSGSTVTPQANAYSASTKMRDFIRTINPLDAHGDFVTYANVFVTGSCNAFYDGSSINFYPAGGGCTNSAYSTVVNHEQGHWLNDRYNTGNGGDGMGEGNADVWSMYLWDTPIIGANWSGSGYIRSGANMTPFCGDCCGGCYGEVHADGEVWMGAAWKVRNNLNIALGNVPGDLAANTLFLSWMNAYNQTQIKSVIETQWVTLDDDDGNLANGSPHFTPIDNGFRTQGFPGLTVIPCASTSIVCTTSPNSVGSGALMNYSGMNDISDNDFDLIATGLPGSQTGLFFFGQTQTQVAFGNGWQCVASPFFRLPPTTSNVLGDLTSPLDLSALPGGAQILAGQTWYFQAWYRDPAAGGANFNASNALRVPWCQ
jgi:hypothetical protein